MPKEKAPAQLVDTKAFTKDLKERVKTLKSSLKEYLKNKSFASAAQADAQIGAIETVQTHYLGEETIKGLIKQLKGELKENKRTHREYKSEGLLYDAAISLTAATEYEELICKLETNKYVLPAK